jgi:anthranilate phosphoribosyltransferase
MSGLTDLIRERRAQEIRVWREEEDEAKATEKAVWGSLGLLVAQRFQSAEEQAEVIQRVLQGRLSLEYILWNGRTDVILPTDAY